MTYDEWKTTDPRKYQCEKCAADARYLPKGWSCAFADCPSGRYRDPDAEYERQRDDKMWDDQP